MAEITFRDLKNMRVFKELPILTLDQRWYQLMPEHKKTDEVRYWERRVNELLKKQGRVLEDIKDVENLKGILMDGIVQNMDETDEQKHKKRMTQSRRLIFEAKDKLDELRGKAEDVPTQLQRANQKLMIETVKACYNTINENEKDLDALEELNFLTREHGYATMKNMSDISNRMAFCYETKQRIAEKASEIISDGETIMVESGSSCALLVKYLSETKKDITVITNSSYIARFIRETEGGVTKVIVLGGEYQKEAEVMVGPLVKTCAEAFYVDKLFMGTDGYIPGIGFTSGDMLRAEAAKSMADSTRNSIILTDSSKFSEHGVVMQCRLKDINMVFTDDQVPLEAKDAMEQNGIIVETVPR